MNRQKSPILWVFSWIVAGLTLVLPTLASAQTSDEVHSKPWQLGFPEPATDLMSDIDSFHNFLLWVITIITLIVLGLLLWVIVRYNSKSNKSARQFSHNTMVEVLWTVIPIIILVVLFVPSLRLIVKAEVSPPPDVIIKAIGQSWFWEYEYQKVFDDEEVEIEFAANIVARTHEEEKEARATRPDVVRLLSTDNAVVVPVDKVVQIVVTADAGGVLHAWAIPAFGVKVDAVPGRKNQIWFKANKTGTFYGQCSELCGVGHSFMPIEVHVVSEEDFNAWVKETDDRTASNDNAPTREFAERARNQCKLKPRTRTF